MNLQRSPYARRLERTLLSCALASCLIWAIPVVQAQSTGATVRGQTTADGKVTATNVATGFSRSVAAGDNGGYSLVGLPPGTYRITVESGGETTTHDVILRVGETISLDADSAVNAGNTIDTVEVIGTRLAETKTSEVATYVSKK